AIASAFPYRSNLRWNHPVAPQYRSASVWRDECNAAAQIRRAIRHLIVISVTNGRFLDLGPEEMREIFQTCVREFTYRNRLGRMPCVKSGRRVDGGVDRRYMERVGACNGIHGIRGFACLSRKR